MMTELSVFSENYPNVVSGFRRIKKNQGLSVFATNHYSEFEQNRRSLSQLISHLNSNPIFIDEVTSRVSARNIDDALRFVSYLPANKILPKVAPDGEGGVVFAWEGLESDTLVVIEKGFISAVIRATRPDAEYFHNIPFDCDQIPSEILQAIPALR